MCIINEVTWLTYVLSELPHSCGHYTVGTIAVCTIVLWKLDMHIINEVTWPTHVLPNLPVPCGYYLVDPISVSTIVLMQSSTFTFTESESEIPT